MSRRDYKRDKWGDRILAGALIAAMLGLTALVVYVLLFLNDLFV